MNLNLDGARAIILASSRGLGRSAATELVREGARVAISSRNRENLDAAKDEIVEEVGVDDSMVVTVVCDLSKPTSVPEAIRRAIDELGGLDILVTNSGGTPKVDFEEATRADFRRAYGAILESVIACVDAALPALLENGGTMTHIVAAAAQEPETNHVVANTIRLGIYGLSKSLSLEYGLAGIRSNCICPRKVGPSPSAGDAVSPHIKAYADKHNLEYDDAAAAYIEEIIPLGRRGDLQTFGKLVAVLSSDASSFVTGQALNVDGGWTRSVH